jgi:hypothetical protein
VFAARGGVRHLDRDGERVADARAAQTALPAEHERERPAVAFERGRLGRLAGRQVEDDDGQRVRQHGQRAEQLPALVFGRERLRDFEHAAAERARDRADEGAPAVALRPAHDERPRLARGEKPREHRELLP